jgi:hypothetical protein
MKLGDLINRLREIQEQYPDDLDVQLAQQPRYPMTYGIHSINVLNEIKSAAEHDLQYLNEDAESREMTDEERQVFEDRVAELQDVIHNSQPTVYITEGTFLGYGHSKMWLDDCDD